MKPFIAADILLPRTANGYGPVARAGVRPVHKPARILAEGRGAHSKRAQHIAHHLAGGISESPDVDGRIAAIHTAMADYRARCSTRGVHGF